MYIIQFFRNVKMNEQTIKVGLRMLYLKGFQLFRLNLWRVINIDKINQMRKLLWMITDKSG